MRIASERVKALRERWMLTQGELAELAGLSLYTVHNAETGKSVSVITGRALAQALGVEPEDLAEEPTSPLVEAPKASAPCLSAEEDPAARRLKAGSLEQETNMRQAANLLEVAINLMPDIPEWNDTRLFVKEAADRCWAKHFDLQFERDRKERNRVDFGPY